MKESLLMSAEISLWLQLAGSVFTATGLGHAAWRLRGLLGILRSRRQGETHHVTAVFSADSANAFANAVVSRDWSDASVAEQLSAIHEELRRLDQVSQATGDRVALAEQGLRDVQSEVVALETRSAQRADERIDAALKELRDDSKISLAWDLGFASLGAILTLAGVAVGLWAV